MLVRSQITFSMALLPEEKMMGRPILPKKIRRINQRAAKKILWYDLSKYACSGY
jgi:hypothetical protein